MILKSVNGIKPDNIQHLVDILIKEIQDETQEIEFSCLYPERGERGGDYIIVFDLNELLKSEENLLKLHQVPAWCSLEAVSAELKKEIESKEEHKDSRTVAYWSMNKMREICKRNKPPSQPQQQSGTRNAPLQ